jgi:predicted site-specific integrase-resolvase
VKVRLLAWAQARYTPPPSIHTLRRWARNNEIYPPAERVGRDLYVEADAIRLIENCAPKPSLVERLGLKPPG